MWSPCQHGCGRTRGNEGATSPGDQQTAQWFEMSQERDHTHLLGRIYRSAQVKRGKEQREKVKLFFKGSP